MEGDKTLRIKSPTTVITLLVSSLLMFSLSCTPDTGVDGVDGNTDGGVDGNTQEPATELIEGSINIEVINAEYVGSLQFELVYDYTTLEATSVQAGELAQGAIFESNVTQPGRVWIGLIHPEGISGDGTLAAVSFNMWDQAGQASQLAVLDVKAHSADMLSDIATQVFPGEFIGDANQLINPTIAFLP